MPAIAAAEGGVGNGERNPADDLVSHLSPKSTASEAYRGIRTSILFSSAEQAPQVLIVSSSGPREGKTITSANIAITMAQAGNRVVILDCDMRRPRVHKIFSLSRDRGMSNLLVGNDVLDNVVIRTDIPNLDVIPSGPIPPNPSEVLSSQRMVDLIGVLRGRYDRVIIDTPPITAVTDAVILSKIVDGVVLIVRAGVAHRELVRNAVEQLRQVNSHILGAVLNGVDMGRQLLLLPVLLLLLRRGRRAEEEDADAQEDAQPLLRRRQGRPEKGRGQRRRLNLRITAATPIPGRRWGGIKGGC